MGYSNGLTRVAVAAAGLACAMGMSVGLRAASPTAPLALPMDGTESANLKLVKDWWRIVIESGHLEYVPRYQAEGYVQHNPNISTGRAAFLKAFSEGNVPTNPIPDKLEANIPLAGARGDFVWIMREYKRDDPKDPSKSGYGDGFDLLRVENGQIQEHWDVATRDKDAEDGIVYGRTPRRLSEYSQGSLSPAELRTRAVAVEAAETVYVKRDPTAMSRLFAPDYVEHYRKLQNRATFAADLRSYGDLEHLVDTKPVIALVNGEYVFMMWAATSPEPKDPARSYPWFTYQLMRVHDGKVVEHWSA